MRNCKEFRELLKQYLRAPIREKRAIYKKMKAKASTFFDYCMVFQFGKKEDQIKAFKKMAKTYLNEKYPIRVYRNTLDLCAAIDELNAIDEEHVIEKETFLDKFFRAHHESREDLLFYISVSRNGKYANETIRKLWSKYYETYQGMYRGIYAKEERNDRLSAASTFLANPSTILRSL